MKKSRFDFTAGTRYGRLVLTGESESRKTEKCTKRYEKCICDCGNVTWVCRAGLATGTKSCGCLWMDTVKKSNTKHGLRNSPLYRTFTGIKTRCYNENSAVYKNYGGRGIKCEWNSFEEFYNDMNASYEEHVKKFGRENTSIERIDVNGNYCKENCTRKTQKEQVNNQRTNTIVIINGEQHNLGEWSKILGIPRETLKRHIIYGKIKGEIYRRGTGKMYDYKKNKRGKI